MHDAVHDRDINPRGAVIETELINDSGRGIVGSDSDNLSLEGGSHLGFVHGVARFGRGIRVVAGLK